MTKLKQYLYATNIFTLNFEWSINQSVLVLIDHNKVTTSLNSQQVNETLKIKVNALYAAIQVFNTAYSDKNEVTHEVLINKLQKIQESIQNSFSPDVPRADLIEKIINALEQVINLLKTELKIQQTTASREQATRNMTRLLVASGQGFHQPSSMLKTHRERDKLLEPSVEKKDYECGRCVIL